MAEGIQHRLDLRGAIIPFSLLKVSQVLKIIKPGELLEILCSDPDIKKDLFKILPHYSCELTLMKELEDKCLYRIQLRKRLKSESKEKEKMKLIDIMPIGKWVEMENEINRRSGLNAAVYDVEGIRVTDFKKWANRLCPALRETDKGQEFICAVAHQNIAARTTKTRKTVVDECDAGLMKFAVPIFVEDEFLGVAGGCGLLRNQGQIDTYLVHRTTGLDEEVIEELSEDIETIPNDRLESTISYLEKKVVEIIREFETDPQGSN